MDWYGVPYVAHGPGLWGLFGFFVFLAIIVLVARALMRQHWMGTSGSGPLGSGTWGPEGWTRRGWIFAGEKFGHHLGRNLGGNFARDEAFEIARVRLARSEVQPEEFEELKRSLQPRFQQAQSVRCAEFSPRTRFGRDEALEIARTRLAKGEINAETFEMICRTLES